MRSFQFEVFSFQQAVLSAGLRLDGLGFTQARKALLVVVGGPSWADWPKRLGAGRPSHRWTVSVAPDLIRDPEALVSV